MGLIQNIWLIIKKLIQNILLSFFYISTSNHVSNDNDDNKKKIVITGSTNSVTSKVVVGDGECDLPEGLQEELMPQHMAVILDGNRRWAKQRGLSYVEGYEAGVESLGDFIGMCTKFNIPVVSLFTFSSENWSRPKEEVDFLIQLFERSLKNNMRNTLSKSSRVTVIGDMSKFPASLQEVIKNLEEETKHNTKLHIILGMSYSGQYDIVQACQSIAQKVKDGIIEPKDITKSLIEQELETKISDIPNPDLLIRTSGELRISNYYLWQSAYTEMYFTDTHWPDFGEDDFIDALRSFQQRCRRYGMK